MPTMYLIINKAILPNFLAIVKRNKMTILTFKERSDLLKNIANFFKKIKIEAKKIKGIILFLDSLTFSETRKVLTISNVWGKFMDIPLGIVKKDEIEISAQTSLKDIILKIFEKGKKRLKKRIILPEYYKEPNITFKKS